MRRLLTLPVFASRDYRGKKKSFSSGIIPPAAITGLCRRRRPSLAKQQNRNLIIAITKTRPQFRLRIWNAHIEIMSGGAFCLVVTQNVPLIGTDAMVHDFYFSDHPLQCGYRDVPCGRHDGAELSTLESF
jgi:hypothetical protein